MKSINLIFGCHSHQPVGNFGFVFEEAYENAYAPFVDVLEKYPDVRVTLHYTGPLWDWFVRHRPAFIERLSGLVSQGQVEIMGGGYYEPLLCAIPEQDAIDQIRRMQDFCEEHLGTRPRGMWLTERVWEPTMARTLAKAGVEYTALDDTHFLCSGLRPEELYGYYMTEDEGLKVKVFPILEKLRYFIPFHQVHETIAFLRERATEDGARCAVIHDDGEKFGVWPGTHKSVYGEGWLEEFFAALTENKDWLHSVTYADYLGHARAAGRAYLPCASYHEMMAWALPTEMQQQLDSVHKELAVDDYKAARYGPFVRGGFWRSFLAKYPESNNVQKRMLRVSDRVARLEAGGCAAAPLEKARKLLHEGQCNCAYWHGVFGGLYLNHLRTALYEKLIAADTVLDGVEHEEAGWVRCETVDFDADGNDEVVLENSRLALFVDPTDGGTLFELDYKGRPFNFLNTLARRPEPYHRALATGEVVVGDAAEGDKSIHDLVQAKEQGLGDLLVYDAYRRTSMRDHFLPETITAEALWRGEYEAQGDFATEIYEAETTADGVVLVRHGHVGGEEGGPLTLCKSVTVRPDASSFEIRYDMEYGGDGVVKANFGVEFVVNLLTGDAFDRYYRSEDKDLENARLGTRAEEDGLRHLALRDDWQAMEFGLRFPDPAHVFCFPIETVSQSEGGQERVYQGSVVVPCWPILLQPGEPVSRKIQVEIVETGALA